VDIKQYSQFLDKVLGLADNKHLYLL